MPERTVVLLDWIGWMLMMSTLWSWVYRMLGLRVQTGYLRARRRTRALRKLWLSRYGENFDKLEPIQQWWERRRSLGIEDDAPVFEALRIRFGYYLALRQRAQAGEDIEEEYNELVKHHAEVEGVKPLIVGLIVNTVKTGLRGIILRTLDVITRSVFSGRLGVCLFAVGFILWNVSKIVILAHLGASDRH
jgi:hypothetical protein